MAASTEISRSKIMEGGEIFGRLVAVRRAGLGLSQEDLAARMDSSQSDVAHIEEGRPPSTEALKRLAPALDVEPAKGALWNSLRRRWLWGSLAIAILVPVLVIEGWRSSGTDGGDTSRQLPQAVSAAPAAPPAGVEARENTQKTKAAPLQQDGGERAGQKPPGDSRSGSAVPRQPAGEGPAVLTPRPQPAPAPPGSPVPPEPPNPGSPSVQPPSPGSPPAPPQTTTGKPVGSPGNGPSGGNGPGGTGPPGQSG